MMTVRETLAFIPKGEYHVTYAGTCYPLKPDDNFLMAAFGDFDVETVDYVGDGCYELYVACKPLKNGIPV